MSERTGNAGSAVFSMLTGSDLSQVLSRLSAVLARESFSESFGGSGELLSDASAGRRARRDPSAIRLPAVQSSSRKFSRREMQLKDVR